MSGFAWTAEGDPYHHIGFECTLGKMSLLRDPLPSHEGKPLCPECANLLSLGHDDDLNRSDEASEGGVTNGA